ncbi:hypothetical protein HOU26_gp48 [Escherichia phage IMM-002]|uniref:Uncharacterized protein n=1 Tax=Escherichia phage IMM-002 TaxID=2041760 RepID=A0A384X8A8_9CAUD|nr:hypothetical protein HOU26_gp48 [Escherichia phage IMM-002]ATI17007.1 hypothetical protein [Escherichia phage IMM-002]
MRLAFSWSQISVQMSSPQSVSSSAAAIEEKTRKSPSSTRAIFLSLIPETSSSHS